MDSIRLARRHILSAFALLVALGFLALPLHAAPPTMRWSQLPPIPDAEGFAAPFAGASGGGLIVAGGANIPENKWADVFVKKWYDSVFLFNPAKGRWTSTTFKLPRTLGYGVSATIGDRVICVGGSDATQHYRDVFALRLQGESIVMDALPALPKPCANACGAAIGSTVFIAGGIETSTSTTALPTFWSLDLAASEPRWRELEPCPGSARMLAVAGVFEGSFFLFSGAALTAGADGKPVREYLRDAWRYTPGKGWKRLADLPRAAVAAPSPAAAFGGAGLLLVSGDDGANVRSPQNERHPGFPRNSLAYDVRADQWTIAGETPISRATAPTVQWQQSYVIPNGEVRPRVRTPEIWMMNEVP